MKFCATNIIKQRFWSRFILIAKREEGEQKKHERAYFHCAHTKYFAFVDRSGIFTLHKLGEKRKMRTSSPRFVAGQFHVNDISTSCDIHNYVFRQQHFNLKLCEGKICFIIITQNALRIVISSFFSVRFWYGEHLWIRFSRNSMLFYTF